MFSKLQRIQQQKPRLYEMGAYLVFGVLTTLVNWVVYELLKLILGLSAHPQGSAQYTLIANICQGAAWFLSVLFAYATNRRFVFDSRTKKGGFWLEMWQFISSRALGYVLFDLLLFNVFLRFMGDRPAKLIMNVFVIIFNYLASRFVVFRKARHEGSNQQ
ncbi:MAG: GtrA family protein [Clostridiales bacterium]|nr:GtrA family protein [Clostridiales bacterium]